MSEYSDLILSDTPVVYWRLGSAAGVEPNLGSLQPYGATFLNVVTRNGQPGALLRDSDGYTSFNGTNSSVVGPSVLAMGAYSFEGWFHKPSWNQAGNPQLINDQSGGSNVNGSYMYQLSATGKIVFGHNYFGFIFVQSNTTPSSFAWHHIVGTYDGLHTFRIYIDGVLDATSVYTGSELPGANWFRTNTTAPLRLARHGTSSGAFFQGSIDEAAVYYYELSAAQVARHYAAGRKRVLRRKVAGAFTFERRKARAAGVFA